MSEYSNLSEWKRLAFMDIETARHMYGTYHPKPRYPAELGLLEEDAAKAIEHAETVMRFAALKLEVL